MERRNEVFSFVIENFSNEEFCFKDIRIEVPDGFVRKTKHDFDLIIFNSKRVLFFIRVPAGVGNNEIVFSLRAALNCLANKLSISLNSVIACGVSANRVFYLNKFNDKLFAFDTGSPDGFYELIGNELQYGPDMFDYAAMRKLSDSLILTADTTERTNGRAKVKTSADGTVYIRKHGLWREASDVDTNELYTVAALTGMLGGHLFYLKKRGKAVLYLLTLGFFGFGWFFDCIEILLGVYKDSEGRYLLPATNRLQGLLWLLLGTVIFFVIGFASMYFWRFILNFIGEIGMELIP